MNIKFNPLRFIFNNETTSCETIATALSPIFASETPVVLCIGSANVVGDSVGPQVGETLSGVAAHIYGTLAKPVNALNLIDTVQHIKTAHPKSKIIAVDSCLDCTESIGVIDVCKKGLSPRKAMGDELPAVGDVSIKIIVNKLSDNFMRDLHLVNPDFVKLLADNVCLLIKCILDKNNTSEVMHE